MSETADSFEEIEFQQSGGSTSDQESSDFTDQQSSSSTTTMSSTMSSTEMKTAQLKRLEFELSWDARDEIICNLNDHMRLLSGQTIKPDARETMRKVNCDLIVALLDLPVNVDDRSKRFESASSKPNEVVLDLTWTIRSRILDALITNRQIAMLDGDSISNDFKSKLIDENQDLVYELLKLRSRTVAKGIGELR